MTERVVRPTSRLLVLDEGDRLLLMKTVAPDTSRFARWITPGGGVDPGETHVEAAVRELHEETGQVVTEVGDVVRVDDFEVPWDDADHTHGHAEFFVVRLPHFEVVDDDWTDDERNDILASRWFTLDELTNTDEPVEPADLGRPDASGARPELTRPAPGAGRQGVPDGLSPTPLRISPG